MRSIALVVVAGLLSVVGAMDRAFAQSDFRFEVASIKRSALGSRSSTSTRGLTYTAMNRPVRSILLDAFGLAFERFRLVGGPSWIDSERFDITARMPDNTSPADTRNMLRSLLAERFALKFHTETRELPTYTLRMARSDRRLGPGLNPSDVDCAALAAERASRREPPAPGANGEAPPCSFEVDDGWFRARAQSMENLIGILSLSVGRRVVDDTKLTGYYDFELKFSLLNSDVASADRRSIFTALREQLGLTLESTRWNVEVFVIDRVEHPTED
jgi:uncharacterized protein (TIGR03435 family)